MDGSTDYGARHPLDLDLADFVASLADKAERARLEAHLEDCLLCRIKVRRLRDAEGAWQHDISDTTDLPGRAALASSPEGQPFFTPHGSFDHETPDAPSQGEVWSVGGDERMLVLITAIHGDRVLVAPVTFDVEAMDDEAVGVDPELSPFNEPLAVYPALASEVSRPTLRTRLGSVAVPSEIGRLLDGSMSGTRRGTPIDGPTDPRLELRQMLVDRLGSLEEITPDAGTGADAPPPHPEQTASTLAKDLRDRRGHLCNVRLLSSWGDIAPAHARGWMPIATVEELGVLLVVFDTPHGLQDDADFDAALAVLTRLSASAVVVLETSLSPLANLYGPSDLNYGIEVPSGEWTSPRALLPALVPVDAITKFLEQSTSLMAPTWASRGSVTGVDVGGVLSEALTTALADITRQGQRAKIPPKVRGYSSLESLAGELEQILRGALAGHPVVDDLLRITEERHQ